MLWTWNNLFHVRPGSESQWETITISKNSMNLDSGTHQGVLQAKKKQLFNTGVGAQTTNHLMPPCGQISVVPSAVSVLWFCGLWTDAYLISGLSANFPLNVCHVPGHQPYHFYSLCPLHITPFSHRYLLVLCLFPSSHTSYASLSFNSPLPIPAILFQIS